MATLAEQAAALEPTAIAVDEIPETVELSLEGTGRESLGGKAIFAAQLDEAGTVNVTVYVPEGWSQSEVEVNAKHRRPANGRRDTTNGMLISGDGTVCRQTYELYPKRFRKEGKSQEELDAAKLTVIGKAPADADPGPQEWKLSF